MQGGETRGQISGYRPDWVARGDVCLLDNEDVEIIPTRLELERALDAGSVSPNVFTSTLIIRVIYFGIPLPRSIYIRG